MRMRFGRRRRPMSAGQRAIFMPFVGVVVIVIGIVGMVSGSELERLESTGVHAAAEVITARQATRESRRNGRTRTSHEYFVTVRYLVPDGTPVESEREVDATTFRKYQQATPERPMPTAVIADPSRPDSWYEVNEFRHRRSVGYPGWILLLIGAGALAYGVFSYFQWKRERERAPEALAQWARPVPFPAQGRPSNHVLYDRKEPPGSHPQG